MDTQQVVRLPNRQWKYFLMATVAIVLCFGLPLYRLTRFALGNELFSYIVLVPFISGYLIHLKSRDALIDSRPWRGIGILAAAAGAGVLITRFLLVRSQASPLEQQDDLAMLAFSVFLFILGAAFFLLGRETMRAYAFAFGMLIFIAPIPVVVVDNVETFLQYGSAYAAHSMYWLAQMPFVRTDLVFQLPGIALRVAPECSGIHSTLILFITSLLAGHLFLRSTRNKAILSLAVLPLALLRNGFRVFTLGELCVHISPEMIDSPIHHKGGPIFFVLSLVPFFLLLWFLHRRERSNLSPEPKSEPQSELTSVV